MDLYQAFSFTYRHQNFDSQLTRRQWHVLKHIDFEYSYFWNWQHRNSSVCDSKGTRDVCQKKLKHERSNNKMRFFFEASFSWKVIKGNEVKYTEVNGHSCLGCKTQSDSSDSKIDTKETTGHQNSTTQKNYPPCCGDHSQWCVEKDSIPSAAAGLSRSEPEDVKWNKYFVQKQLLSAFWWEHTCETPWLLCRFRAAQSPDHKQQHWFTCAVLVPQSIKKPQVRTRRREASQAQAAQCSACSVERAHTAAVIGTARWKTFISLGACEPSSRPIWTWMPYSGAASLKRKEPN